jgi:hypothetical protein
MPLSAITENIHLDVCLSEEISDPHVATVVGMLLSNQQSQIDEAIELLEKLIFDLGDNGKKFTLHCILTVYADNSASARVKEDTTKVLLQFFLHCYNFRAYDKAVKQITRLVDDFPDVVFAIKADLILDFVVMLQKSSESRFVGFVERLSPEQLNPMCAMIAYTAVQRENINVKTSLAVFLQRALFLKLGLSALDAVPKLSANDINPCVTQFSILIIFLRQLENASMASENKKIILDRVERIISNFPEPSKLLEQKKLYFYLDVFIETYRQYYDPYKNKRESNTAPSIVNPKDDDEKIQKVIRELQEKKVALGSIIGKRYSTANISSQGFPKADSIPADLDEELRKLIQRFWLATSVNARVDIVIQIYLRCLTQPNELMGSCLEYLSNTVGWSRESSLTPEFLHRQRFLYAIGHQYQGQQMSCFARGLVVPVSTEPGTAVPVTKEELSINDWLATLSDEALQTRCGELRAEYREKLILALEQAIEEGEILLLTSIKLEQEQLRIILKSPAHQTSLELPQVAQFNIYVREHTNYRGAVLFGNIYQLDKKYPGPIEEIDEELQRDVKYIRRQMAYLNFVTALLSGGVNPSVSSSLESYYESDDDHYFANLKYLQSHERMPYQIFVGPEGKLCKFDEDTGCFIPASTKNKTSYNKVGWAAFVVTALGEIFTVDKHEDFIFNHASFAAGAPVRFAGELYIGEDGSLLEISDLSGHHKPKLDSLISLIEYLQGLSVNVESCKVHVNNEKERKKVDTKKQELESGEPSTSSADLSSLRATSNLEALKLSHSMADFRHLGKRPVMFSKMHNALRNLIAYIDVMLRNTTLVREGLRNSLFQLKEDCSRALKMKNLSRVIAFVQQSVCVVISVPVDPGNFLAKKIRSDLTDANKNLDLVDFVECFPEFVKPAEPFLYCQAELIRCSIGLEKELRSILGDLFFLIMPRFPQKNRYDFPHFEALIDELWQELNHTKNAKQFISGVIARMAAAGESNPGLRRVAEEVSRSIVTPSQFSLFKENSLRILDEMKILCEFNFQSESCYYSRNFNTESLKWYLFDRSWKFLVKEKAGTNDSSATYRSVRSLFKLLREEPESLEQFVLKLYDWLAVTTSSNLKLINDINVGIREFFPDCRNLGDVLQQLQRLPQYYIFKSISFLFTADAEGFIGNPSDQVLAINAMRRHVSKLAATSSASLPDFVVQGGNNFCPPNSNNFVEVYNGLPPAFAVMGDKDHKHHQVVSRTDAAKPADVARTDAARIFGFFAGSRNQQKSISNAQVEYTMSLKPSTENRPDELDGRAFYATSKIDLDYLKRNGWTFNMPNEFYSIEADNAVLLFLNSRTFVKDFLKLELRQRYTRKDPTSKRPLAVDRVNNQFLWLLMLLRELKARGKVAEKPRILIWHYPLYPVSNSSLANNATDFLQARHLAMLQTLGIVKTTYHEILQEVLLRLRLQLASIGAMPLFSAVFSGHEHVNSVVHNPEDLIAPLHCTFGTGGTGLQNRERSEPNAFFSNVHGFAHIQIVGQVINVMLNAGEVIWNFSSEEGLVLNELVDVEANKFRKAIIRACDNFAKSIAASAMGKDVKRGHFACIDKVKQLWARPFNPDVTIDQLAEDVSSIDRDGLLIKFLGLFGFINEELKTSVLTNVEQAKLQTYISESKEKPTHRQLYRYICEILADRTALLQARTSKDDIAIIPSAQQQKDVDPQGKRRSTSLGSMTLSQRQLQLLDTETLRLEPMPATSSNAGPSSTRPASTKFSTALTLGARSSTNDSSSTDALPTDTSQAESFTPGPLSLNST